MHKAVTLLGFSAKWTWARAGQVLLLALAYFASAKLALLLAIPPGYATPIWPASGIALAAMLVAGRAIWPGVWLGSLAANLSIEGSVLSALVIASGSAAQSTLASWAIGRHVGVPYRFAEVQQVIKFVGLCIVCATPAASVALVPLALSHSMSGRDLFWNWWTWWQGDTSGMLVATPLILSWVSKTASPWDLRRALEALALSILLLGSSYFIFQGFGESGAYPTTFVVVPLIVWSGFRFGQRGVTTATAAICGVALWYTIRRESGPFAGTVTHEALLLLLAFVCTLVVTGLVLCAVLDQLDRAIAELRGRQAELESRVSLRTEDLERANRRLEEDIAARKRTEQMLIESERRFRLMVDSVEEYAIFRLDTEGRVASWNAGAQRISGYREDEIIGEHFSKFYPAEDVERGKPAWELEVVAREGRYQEEGWRVRKDGSRYWANVLITAVRDDDGELLGFSKVTRDLTERNRADAELIRAKVAAEKASEAKSQFLANLSHELRTPLNSLLILARLLADNTTENLTPKQIQFAQTIYASGMDLLTLINDLLDLAKIESGAITSVHIAPARLQDLREELERTFRQVAQDKGLGFSIATAGDVPATIRTDMPRLKQILKNLLANAFKFTRRGEVALKIDLARSGWSAEHPRLSSAPAVIAFSVVDTGIGIPREKQTLIFEAFQQADGTTSRQYGGTGLGLSISREFTRLLGGEISLRSEAGKGSTFTLYLPVLPEAVD